MESGIKAVVKGRRSMRLRYLLIGGGDCQGLAQLPCPCPSYHLAMKAARQRHSPSPPPSGCIQLNDAARIRGCFKKTECSFFTRYCLLSFKLHAEISSQGNFLGLVCKLPALPARSDLRGMTHYLELHPSTVPVR